MGRSKDASDAAAFRFIVFCAVAVSLFAAIHTALDRAWGHSIFFALDAAFVLWVGTWKPYEPDGESDL